MFLTETDLINLKLTAEKAIGESDMIKNLIQDDIASVQKKLIQQGEKYYVGEHDIYNVKFNECTISETDEQENEQLKSFTFSKINQFGSTNESNVFSPKKQFLDIIFQNDTNWFSQTLIEVILEVDNVAKEYFFRKDILPNKQILEQKDNSFTISTKVSYDDEILKVVKYWIPYIKIISPLYLQEKFNKILEDYLKTTQPCNEECNTS